MSEKKLAMPTEMAENEFTDWAESIGLDLDEDGRAEADATVLASGKRFFVKAMTRGLAVINDSGDLVYTVSAKSPDGYANTDVTITTPPPRAFIDSGKKDVSGMQRILAIASGMTGKDTGWFMKLALPDFKFFLGIAGLFLLD